MNRFLILTALLACISFSAQAGELTRATMDTDGISFDGLAVTISETNTFDNDGNTFLIVANDTGITQAITFTSVLTSVNNPSFGTITLEDVGATIPTGETHMFGPFPTGRWNNATGHVTAMCGASATMTAVAVKVE